MIDPEEAAFQQMYNTEFNDIARHSLSEPIITKCECKCTGLEAHSDHLCGRPATMFVTLHRYGFCDQPPDADGYREPENVDADGNINTVMCGECAEHAYQVAARNIKTLRAHLPRHMVPHCPTCNRPMVTAEDLFQRRLI